MRDLGIPGPGAAARPVALNQLGDHLGKQRRGSQKTPAKSVRIGDVARSYL
jgi:hypothetical protein